VRTTFRIFEVDCSSRPSRGCEETSIKNSNCQRTPGCPISRSFFARYGIPLPYPGNLGVFFFREGERSRLVESHISRKTSEMPRISCTRPWTRLRVRLSLRKGALSVQNPRDFTGNRGCGAPRVCGQDRSKLGNEVLRRALLPRASQRELCSMPVAKRLE
jgi:hypothetical protein